MALNRIQAARLLSDREMALFETSLADQVGGLTARELSTHIRQLRTQRDKYRDLHQRQRVATRQRTGSKAGPSGQDNERTARKAQAFDEALHRLERQQTRVEAAQARRDAADGGGGRGRARPANAPAGRRPRSARPTAPGGRLAASGPPRASDSPRPSRRPR